MQKPVAKIPVTSATNDCTGALIRWKRHSVARAVLVGLFVAPLPIPSQMLLAGLLATLLRANLPLAVSLVWLSNPLTILPIAWFCTLFGCLLTGQDAALLMALPQENLLDALAALWQPLFIGALCSGLLLGVSGYYLTHLYWRGAALYHRHTSSAQRATPFNQSLESA